MKLEGLMWNEIQDIRMAIEEKKRKFWKELTINFSKDATHKQIADAYRHFNEERNPFRDEGRYNRILEKIQDLDDEIKLELEKEEGE